MSVTPLADVKRAMRIIGTADDVFLQQLVDSAEDEALRFLNRTQLPTLPADNPGSYDSEGNPILTSEDIPSSEDPVAASIFTAIVCLVLGGVNQLLQKHVVSGSENAHGALHIGQGRDAHRR